MKIALASPYDFATHGGVNQHIAHLKTEFERLGHRVVVIAPLSESNLDVDRPDFHGFGGVLPVSANGSVARISFSLNLRRRIKHLMEREQFDIVHCHEPLMPALPLVVLNYSRAVNIGTFHAYAESNLGYFYARPVLHRFFDRLDGLVAVSEPARAFASQYFEGNWRIIPNGVDTSAFSHPTETLPELMDGRPNILFIGRFEEGRKGFKYLLKAIPWVKEIFPDIRLIVIGRGSPAKYTSRIERYGIEDNVLFAGPVADEVRLRYMAGSLLLVAPSTHGESQGVVLLEAMAGGLPVIGGDIPGYSSILSHGREGLLVPTRSEHSIALAIVRLLSDESLRTQMSAWGRTRAEQHSWPKVAAQLLEYYTDECDRKSFEDRRESRRAHLRIVLKRARGA